MGHKGHKTHFKPKLYDKELLKRAIQIEKGASPKLNKIGKKIFNIFGLEKVDKVKRHASKRPYLYLTITRNQT